MRKLIYIAIITLVAACDLSNMPVTYPPGAKLCRQNTDCFEGQWCGFQSGYTAAICKGQAVSNQFNLR